MKYYVYLIECGDGSIYTGITTDVARRVEEHRQGKGSHYTRARKVDRLLYSEEHENRSSALRREAEIKSWPASQKRALIVISPKTRRKNEGN